MIKVLLTALLLCGISLNANSFQESAMNGYYEAEGYSAPGQTRFAAMISAKVDAQRRLLEIIQGAKINSVTTILNGVLASDIVVSRIKGMIQGARMTAREYDKSSGTAMIRLAVDYKAVLNTAMEDPKFKDAFFGMAKSSQPEFVVTQQTIQPVEVTVNKVAYQQTATLAYDGLIVDATATDMEPAYINRVFSNSQIVYDPTKVPQQVIVDRGLASYTVDVNKAKAILETYGVRNPLIVRATSTTKLKSDVNIDINSASLVAKSNGESGFLESAKIVFVLR